MSDADPPGLRLLNDHPVSDGVQDDLLGRSEEAARLADLLRDSRHSAPFTFAVYADWGMGKSSLLRLAATCLTQHPDVEVVWFNAWLAVDGGGLEMLVKSVLDRLDPSSLRRLARAVSGDSKTASWSRVLLRGLAGTVRLHHLVDGIWERMAIDARTRANSEELIRTALADFTGANGSARRKRTIVVFVDDLDRCPAQTIREVCAAMKQYLAVPGLVFVLGCDRSVIEGAVGRSGHDTDGVEGDGRRFLEKIIQASYPVPAPTDAQIDKLIAGYARSAGAAALFQGAVVDAVKRHSGRNPRRVKQLINRLVTEYRLDPEWEVLGAEALFSAALMQDLYPEFHRLLYLSADMDPLEEFTGYLAVRDAVRASDAHDVGPRGADEKVSGQTFSRERALKCLRKHGVALRNADEVNGAAALQFTGELLDALERDLPETFPELARDRTFTGLVQALDDTTVREQLSAKMRRRGLEAAKAATQEFGLPRHDEAGSAAELSGLRLLWLDSHGSQRGFLRKQLDQAGASVTCATQLHEVIDAVAAGRFDVVVTNLKRPIARDGGFDDIAEMRRAGYDGPFVVYTGYVSPARRERAARERVSITAEPDEARQLIIQAWTGGQSSGLDLAGITALWLAPYSNLPFLRHLGARGADVVEADSPAGAIAAIRSQAIDAVVADPFPGWKGFAYISELRKEAESAELLPALVLAHRATPQRRRDAAALGIEITDDAAMATRWLARIAAAKAAPDAA